MENISIGILGAANIVDSALIEPAKKIGGIQITALASKSTEKARHLAKKYSIKHIYDDYSDLIRNSSINTIYIALPNSLHSKYIIEAVNSNKHILVEKPICLSAKECEHIARAIGSNKDIIILEALMAQHHAWTETIKEIVDSKKYGQLKKIKTRITMLWDDTDGINYRYFPDLGGGVFLDNSAYWLLFIQKCIGLDKITDFNGFSDFNGPNGVDLEFNAKLKLNGNIEVEFYTSYIDPYQTSHTLFFDDAEVIVNNFWRPVFGCYKFQISIHINGGLSEKIILPAESYYDNQLKFFVSSVYNRSNNIPIQDSFDRVTLMELIYEKAKKRHVNKY